jgi:hypothetical protein
VSTESQGPGWWRASDGNWYPPAQQPTQAPPSEGIAVTTRRIGLTLWGPKPKIFVDGSEVPGVRWGRTVVPAGPGQHHVHVHIPYFLSSRGIGAADTNVQVPPGKLAELEYKAPAWTYSPGSLGVGPQPYNGVTTSIAVYVALAALWAILAFASHRGLYAFPAIIFVVGAVVLLVQSGLISKSAQPSSQQAAVAANWYPDPNDPTVLRYFDGRNWTAQTKPRA